VEVVINPEELEGLSEAEMEELYNQRLAEARSASGREDFSGMVAAKAQQQKRKAAAVRDAKAAKKSKDDFKF
jgi:splicing factor 3B subunit 2